jgi:hypothetical protein
MPFEQRAELCCLVCHLYGDSPRELENHTGPWAQGPEAYGIVLECADT